MLHLLKWKYQEVRRGRNWELTIDEQRLKFAETLEENPGLKPKLDEILKKAYQYAVIQAARETKISKSVFPYICPWTLDQITDDAFFPDS